MLLQKKMKGTFVYVHKKKEDVLALRGNISKMKCYALSLFIILCGGGTLAKIFQRYTR